MTRALSDRNSATWGLVAIVLAAMLFAIAAIVASELFQAGVKPFELAAARSVIAAIGLALISQFRVFNFPTPARKLLDWRILALGLSLALITVSYYVAIDRLAVAVAIVIQYTAPALVVGLTALQARRLPAPATLFAVGTALLGVVLVSGVATGQLQFDALGLMAAGSSALLFASYTLLSAAAVDTYGAIGVMFRAFIVASLFWLAFQVSQGFPEAVFAPANLPGILFVGVGGTLVPFSLICWGIQQVRADRAAIVATLEPVMATLLAWLWLGQTLSGMQILGGVLVLLAVVSLQICYDAASLK